MLYGFAKVDAWPPSVGFQFFIEKAKPVMFCKDIRWKNILTKLQMWNNDTYEWNKRILEFNLWCTLEQERKSRNLLNVMRKKLPQLVELDRSTLVLLNEATVLFLLDYGGKISGWRGIGVERLSNIINRGVIRKFDPVHSERSVLLGCWSSPKINL